MKPTIRVQMLGGLSVEMDGRPLLENATKVTKPWQVFCYLLMNRPKPLPPAEIIAALWPGESLADPANVLKNTVYALRKEFRTLQVGDDEDPILFEQGGYVCAPGAAFDVDAEHFLRLVNRAKDAQGEEKLRLLLRASALYKGDFLPQLTEEPWAVRRRDVLRKMFCECVSEACELLYEQRRFSELLAQASRANKIYPLEEAYYLHLFRALYHLGMYRVMLPIYQKTARLFMEELGTTPCEEIRTLYGWASERVNPIEQDIMIIKDDLREVSYDNSPADGPLYCSYDVFKYLYQMVARTSERSGNRILIILLSLVEDTDAAVAPPQEGGEFGPLAAAMASLREELLGGLLRKNDTVARYSKSQYIVMLSSEQANGADAVVRRIKGRSEDLLASTGLRLVFATTELEREQ